VVNSQGASGTERKVAKKRDSPQSKLMGTLRALRKRGEF